MNKLALLLLVAAIGTNTGINIGMAVGHSKGHKLGVIHGRNLQRCETVGGKWLAGQCWRQHEVRP